MIFKKENIEERLQKIEESLQKLLEISQKLFESLQKIEERSLFSSYAIVKTDDFENFVDFCADLMKKDKTFWFDVDNENKTVKIYSISKGMLISKLNWIMKKTNFKQLEIIEIK